MLLLFYVDALHLSLRFVHPEFLFASEAKGSFIDEMPYEWTTLLAAHTALASGASESVNSFPKESLNLAKTLSFDDKAISVITAVSNWTSSPRGPFYGWKVYLFLSSINVALSRVLSSGGAEVIEIEAHGEHLKRPDRKMLGKLESMTHIIVDLTELEEYYSPPVEDKSNSSNSSKAKSKVEAVQLRASLEANLNRILDWYAQAASRSVSDVAHHSQSPVNTTPGRISTNNIEGKPMNGLKILRHDVVSQYLLNYRESESTEWALKEQAFTVTPTDISEASLKQLTSKNRMNDEAHEPTSTSTASSKINTQQSQGRSRRKQVPSNSK